MRDIYLYEGTDVLKNLLDIRDRKLLEDAEADYVTFRLKEIAIKHISKYYVLHITIYFVALWLHGYIGFESYQCWLLMLLSMVITEIMVRSYLMFRFKLSG